MSLDWLLKGASLDAILDSGYLPQSVIRIGIRRQLAERLRDIASTSLASSYETKMKYINALRTRPMAIETGKANEQHYEVGTGVLQACLGERMKYSCCLYEIPGADGKVKKVGGSMGDKDGGLDEAEERMLGDYVRKAGLVDGMSILDLGCGWGSLSLYLAAKFPSSRITGFSNSSTQKLHIDSLARAQSLTNLTIITGDVVDYEFEPSTYDRVLSIELFEHMKNYELLLAKVGRVLKPGGKLFVHIFAHKDSPYDFEEGWMTEHFFSGGTMPSADLLLYFQNDLQVKEQWWVNGMNYAKTCEAWLANMNRNRKQIWPHLEETYGKDKAEIFFYRWQIFYMACAELFAYEGGDVWGVAHYLFEKKAE